MKKKALVILVWLCIWQLLAMIVHNDILLVGPVETVRALAALFPEKEFRISLVASFIRIVGGFLAGSLLGMLSAFWAYRKPLFGAFLSPLVTMLKTVPVVMHSSLSHATNREMGKKVGVDAYVTKFNARELSDIIRPLLLRK